MHFVVLIAGLGSRLGDLTKERPKCLIEIDGKTILERLLEQAEETGEFTDIIVLTGYMSETINEFIDGWNQRENGLRIRAVHNPNFYKTNNGYSLWCAKDVIKNAFVLCDGDLVLDTTILKRIVYGDNTSKETSLVAVDMQSKLDAEAMKFTRNENGFINKLSKEISIFEGEGESIGLCRITTKDVTEIFYYLDKMIKEGMLNDYYERAFQEYLLQGWKPKVIDIGDLSWVEIDDELDFQRAQLKFEIQ